MGAGSVIVGLVILIAIGVGVYLFWPQICSYVQPFANICGKTNSKPQSNYQYSNDIISVEDYAVSSTKPSAGSATTIEFYLQNNGDKDVKGVIVDFFDPSGFTINSLICNGEESADKKTCVLDIDSFDNADVQLNLQAPSPDLTARSYTISYSVEYNYSGFRRADIPVIDGITRTKPLNAFAQSVPSYGPVQVSFEPPVGKETKTDTTTTKEYWVVGDRPFEVKMSFESVVTPSGNPQRINITKKNVYIDLKGVSAIATAPDNQQMPCDFGPDGNLLTSNKDLIIPGTMTCNFKTIQEPNPELTVTLDVGFNYTYKFIRTETFDVQPIPKA